MSGDGQVLVWTGRVLTAEDLRRNLNGQRSVALSQGTVVTPLAREHLRERGIVVYAEELKSSTAVTRRGYAQDRSYPAVSSAIVALNRAGTTFLAMSADGSLPAGLWSKAIASGLPRGDCESAVVFCDNPGLFCCVANKIPGIRAAAVTTPPQAARARTTVGANLVAVEMPGRTYFEVLQILRLFQSKANCPAEIARTLEELDGHAHR
jgi:hypothetical protein